MEKPLYTTRWKPVLMFTKAELKKSAALIDGMGPKRTEKIWESMPFEHTICGAYKGDHAIQYILLKLVESRGLPHHHYHNEELYRDGKGLMARPNSKCFLPTRVYCGRCEATLESCEALGACPLGVLRMQEKAERMQEGSSGA